MSQALPRRRYTPGVPIYLQIKEALLDQIKKGEFAAGQTFPSEEELASTYEVSRTTIRRAVSDLVDLGLLDRRQGLGTFVIDTKVPSATAPVAHDASHAGAEGAEKQHMPVIGVLIHDRHIYHSYYEPITRAICCFCEEQKYQLHLLPTSGDSMLTPQNQFFMWLLERGALDGLLLVVQLACEDIQRLQQMATPFVVLSNEYPALGVPFVRADTRGEAEEAVRLLRGHGHRRIALLCGQVHPAGDGIINYKSEVPGGYRDALARSGLVVDEQLIMRVSYARDAAFEAVCELLARPERPTALIVSSADSDGVIEAIGHLGLKIPEDIELAHIGVSRPVSPNGIVFLRPLYEMSKTAMQLLGDLVAGRPLAQKGVLRESKVLQCGLPGVATS